MVIISSVYMTDLIQKLVDEGYSVKPAFFKDPWVEVDSIDDFKSLENRNRLNIIEDIVKKYKSNINVKRISFPNHN